MPAIPDNILDAAAAAFAAHGFAGARVEAIAQAAGVNKATLYYQVGDKAALYEAVVLHLFGQAAARAEALVEGVAPGDRLAALLQGLAALFQGMPHLPRIMAWELASGAATLPPAALPLWGRLFRLVSQAAALHGHDPALGYFAAAGGMILFFLSEPLRQRAAAVLPGAPPRLAEASPGDMAAFLLRLLVPDHREDSPCADA